VTPASAARWERPASPRGIAPLGQDPLSVWLRTTLWHLLTVQDHTQAWLANEVGITPKHLNQMLQGKVGISADLGSRMLAALGYELVLAMRPLITAAVIGDPS
jgi:hypothetical protein